MAIRLDSAGLVSEFLHPSSPATADEEELSLCHSFLLLGLSLLGNRENAVALLCQKLEEWTSGHAKIHLFQPEDQVHASAEARRALALLSGHDYVIHLHELCYGWLVTSDVPELSSTLLKHLARLCGMLFYLYETSTFVHEQIQLSPSMLAHALTPRQRRVLVLMAQGSSDQKIAQELSIAYATVRKHREAIYAKLGVHSYHQIVQAAFLTGLYQPLADLAPVVFLDEQELAL